MDALPKIRPAAPLWILPGPLYCAGAPVLIRGCGLWDRGGRPVCRITLQNIGPLTLRAVTVALQPLDENGAALGPETPYRYRKLSANRDDCFGGRTDIVLPVDRAAAVSLRVLRVDYAGGEPWQSEAAWTPLTVQKTLEDAYGDPELAEQFRIRYGADCRYALTEDRDLWLCTCGAVNRRGEPGCHSCRRVQSALREVPARALQAESVSRRKSEQARQESDDADRRQLRKRILIAAGIILPVLFLVIALLSTVPAQLQRQQQYEAAQRLMALGEYESAARAFTELGDYRDSAEQAEKAVPYAQALDLMERARKNDTASLLLIGHSRTELNEETNAAMLLYEAAGELFRSLGGYEDSAKLARECEAGIAANLHDLKQSAYDEAAALLDSGSYSAARAAFLALGDYADSAQQARECVYRKALALLDYIRRYDVRGVYALITMEPEETTRFALSTEKAVSLGEHSISDLLAACGEDLSDVSLTGEPPEGLTPIADAVSAVFAELGDYGDSAACLEAVAVATDYTRDFWLLCENGDIRGAYDWLSAYSGDFDERQFWLDALTAYLPYCRGWALYMGDATVIPLTVGAPGNCNSFDTRVFIRDDAAWLRISGADYGFELRAEIGSVDFHMEQNGSLYMGVISNVGRFAYMRYGAQGNLISSCEYSAIE